MSAQCRWILRLLIAAWLFPVAAAAATYQVAVNLEGAGAASLDVVFDLLDGDPAPSVLEITHIDSDGRVRQPFSTGDVSVSSDSAVLKDRDFFTEYGFTVTLPKSLTFVFTTSVGYAVLPHVPDAFTFFILDHDSQQSLIDTTDPTGANALFAYQFEDDRTPKLAIFQPLGTPIQWSVTSTVPEPSRTLLLLLGLGCLFPCVAARETKRRGRALVGALPTGWPARLGGVALCCFAAHASAQAVDPPTDITAAVDVTRSGYTYNRSTSTFDSIVTLSPRITAINGPVNYIIDAVYPTSVSVVNPTGRASDGKPYFTVMSGGSSLQNGQVVTFVVKFANPTRTTFSSSYRLVGNAVVGRPVSFARAQAPRNPFAGFPTNPATGRPVLMSTATATLEFDPSASNELTAASACAGWIAACFSPGQRELDDCVRSAPVCRTSKPWQESTACCPSSCSRAYAVARVAGKASLDALLNVYVDARTCF